MFTEIIIILIELQQRTTVCDVCMSCSLNKELSVSLIWPLITNATNRSRESHHHSAITG